MKIYVFKRPDDSVWADYSEEHAKRFKILETIEASTRGELEALVKEATLPRVKALADRALKEMLAIQKPRRLEPVIADTPMTVSLRDRGFWGRLRWLMSGS